MTERPRLTVRGSPPSPTAAIKARSTKDAFICKEKHSIEKHCLEVELAAQKVKIAALEDIIVDLYRCIRHDFIVNRVSTIVDRHIAPFPSLLDRVIKMDSLISSARRRSAKRDRDTASPAADDTI